MSDNNNDDNNDDKGPARGADPVPTDHQRAVALVEFARGLAQRIKDRCAEIERIMEAYREYAAGLQIHVRPLREESHVLEDEIHEFFAQIYLTRNLELVDERKVELLYQHLCNEGWLQYTINADECRLEEEARKARGDARDTPRHPPGVELPCPRTPRGTTIVEVERETMARASAVAFDRYLEAAREDPNECCALVEAEIESLQAQLEDLESVATEAGIDALGQLIDQAATMGAPMGLSAWEYIAAGAEDIHKALQAIHTLVGKFLRSEIDMDEFLRGPKLHDEDEHEGDPSDIEMADFEGKTMDEIVVMLLDIVKREEQRLAATRAMREKGETGDQGTSESGDPETSRDP